MVDRITPVFEQCPACDGEGEISTSKPPVVLGGIELQSGFNASACGLCEASGVVLHDDGVKWLEANLPEFKPSDFEL